MKAIVVQALPEPADELKKVSIGQSDSSTFIFYITKGNDIMLIHPVMAGCDPKVDSGMNYGFRSSAYLLAVTIDRSRKWGNKGITFQGRSRQKCVLNAICAGRTVYTADHMNEVFDIYVQVRKESDAL